MPKDIDKEKAILNFLKSPDEIEPEVIRQGLKDFGYDPDEVAAKGKEFIQGLLSEARASLQESSSPLPENAERLADEMESQDFDIPEDLDQAIADILAGKMGEGTRQQPRAYWRNFDKATREDKIQILKDIRLLKTFQRKDEGGGERPEAKTVSASEQARKVLAELSVSHPGEASIRDLVRARGALVREGPLHGAESSLVRVGRHGLIRVRESIPEDTRKRYDIAHELGHFELHPEADQLGLCLDVELAAAYKAENAEEIEAHAFANEFLLPEKLLKPRCEGKFPGFEEIKEIAREFETSVMLTTMRLIELTSKPVVLVVSEGGKIRWFRRSQAIFPFLNVGGPVPEESLAHALHKGEDLQSLKRKMRPTVWLPDDEPPDVWLVEECFPLAAYSKVLSLLTFT